MKYIKGFDGLRAFSIIFVLLTHLGLYDQLPDNDFLRDRVSTLFSGLTGVQIFFSLSGFLITRILLIEKNNSGTISLLNFYIRRFLRLLPPLIIFYLAVGVLMYLHQIVTTSVGFIMAVTYTYNFIPAKFYTGELGHMWSLAVEEQFYLFWPLVLLFLSGTKKLFYITSIVVLVCIVAIYQLPLIHVDVNGEAVSLAKLYLVPRWFIPAVAPIMIGSAFAVLTTGEYKNLGERLKNNKWVPVIALLLYLSPLYLPGALMVVYSIFLATGVSLFLLWLYYNQESNACRVLEFKPLSYIGKISYSIYVYQGFFLRTGPSEGLSVQQFPLNIILTITIAILSYEFFEKKILKLRDRFRGTKAQKSIV